MKDLTNTNLPRSITSLIFLVLAAVLCCCSGTSEKEKPRQLGDPPDPTKTPFNVILVSVDTLRADRVGTYGYNERKSSPHMDALAKDGVVFENFITASPWTTPAHLSLLTSLHPSTHGLTTSFMEMWKGLFHRGEFFKLPDSRLTLAEALSEAGFRSVAFTAGGPLEPTIGFDQGFSNYGTSMYKLYEGNTQRMFDWLNSNGDEQFFLFWHHFEVHAPYLNGDFVADAVSGAKGITVRNEIKKIKDIPLSRVWPGGASAQRKKQVSVLREHETFDRDTCEALYVGGVHEADRWLGALVKLLKEKGLYDNTMIVVTSDHGEEFGDHTKKLYYNIHGHILYEEMVHVPLIIKLPESYAAGTRVPQVVQTVDVMPSILDFLKIAPSKNEMQGKSLVPYWTNPVAQGAEGIAYTEGMARKNEKKSLRTSRYKYILSVDQKTVAKHGRGFLPPDRPLAPELYDLSKDPREKRNLLRKNPDARTKAIAQKFDRMLREHISSQQGKAEKTILDKDTVEKLKGLGYMGDDDHPTGPAPGLAPSPAPKKDAGAKFK